MTITEKPVYKILVVEDDLEICRLIEIILKRKNHILVTINDGLSALKLIQNENFDLILLDWMLPHLSGLEVLKEMRIKNNLSPVIFLTAKSQPQDIVMALESGADDYMNKPFDGHVLLARIDSVLRRADIKKNPKQKLEFSRLKYKTININLDTYEVHLKNQMLHLTRSEFKILCELILNCEKVLTRDQLVEKTQGESVNVTTRTIDTHVFGLRKKLGENNDWIETIRGIGYRLSAESNEVTTS